MNDRYHRSTCVKTTMYRAEFRSLSALADTPAGAFGEIRQVGEAVAMLQEEGDPIPERGRPRARRSMKTMTVDDDHYLALEEAARRSDRSVQELVNEAIESWLAEAELDDTEQCRH